MGGDIFHGCSERTLMIGRLVESDDEAEWLLSVSLWRYCRGK